MGYYRYEDDDDYDYLYEDENNDDLVDDILDAYDDYKDLKEKLNEKPTKNVDTNKAANEIKDEVAKDAAKEAAKTGAKAAGSKATTDTVSKASVNSGRAAEEVNAAKNAAKAAETASSAAAGTTEAAAGAATAGEAAAGTAGAAAGGAAGAAGTAGTAGAAIAGESAAGPPGWVIAALTLVADLAKKEHEKRKKDPDDKKVKRFIREFAPIIVIIGSLLAIIGGIGIFFSVGQTVTTSDSCLRLNDFVECMQTDGVCSEILDLELDEELQGYNKPLIIFNYKELKDLANNYIKFSDKYFESGEGLFNESYDEIANELGIENSEDIKKEQIDASVLVNFLSIQARAFSQIHWIEVTVDPGTGAEIEHDITEFDSFYKTKDDYSDVTKWFKWFNVDEYEIKIPLVKKYSVVPTKIQITTTTTNSSGTKTTYGEDQYNIPRVITEEYKLNELRSYIEMVREYLPDWFEPYSIYMATGNVEYAKEYYNTYLNFLGGIEVKLYKEDINYEIDTHVVSKYLPTEGDSETTIVDTEEVWHQEPYAKIVFKGPKALNGVLINAGSYIADSEEGKEEVLIDNKIETSTGDVRDEEGKVIGSYTSTTTTNSKKVTLPGKEMKIDDDRGESAAYCLRFKDTPFLSSKYADLRATIIYTNLCDSKNAPYDFADVGAALETIYDFYYNLNEIEFNIKAGDIAGKDVTYKESAQAGASDIKHGWASTNTTKSGITYRSYKQNQPGAYYTELDYGGFGRFGSWGCPITSAAIMLDMLGVHIDPYLLYRKVGINNPAAAINAYTGKTMYISTSPNKDTIIKSVKAGKPVGIHVGYDHSGSNQHYMVITDYDPNTKKFYVEGVHTGYNSISGWRNYEEIRELNTGDGIDVIYVPCN